MIMEILLGGVKGDTTPNTPFVQSFLAKVKIVEDVFVGCGAVELLEDVHVVSVGGIFVVQCVD